MAKPADVREPGDPHVSKLSKRSQQAIIERQGRLIRISWFARNLLEVVEDIMAQHPKGHRGSDGGSGVDVNSYQSMPSQMESPLNAQKDSPEEGPQAPGGLPKWPVKDPMGFLEPQGKD